MKVFENILKKDFFYYTKVTNKNSSKYFSLINIIYLIDIMQVNTMSSKKKEKTDQQTETITEQEEVIEENIAKIESLIEELDKIEHSGDPNIRICPRCFSVRVKMVDILSNMGINSGYPVCRCLYCG